MNRSAKLITADINEQLKSHGIPKNQWPIWRAARRANHAFTKRDREAVNAWLNQMYLYADDIKGVVMRHGNSWERERHNQLMVAISRFPTLVG